MKEFASILKENLEERFSFSDFMTSLQVFDLRYLLGELKKSEDISEIGCEDFLYLYEYYSKKYTKKKSLLQDTQWKYFIELWVKLLMNFEF